MAQDGILSQKLISLEYLSKCKKEGVTVSFVYFAHVGFSLSKLDFKNSFQSYTVFVPKRVNFKNYPTKPKDGKDLWACIYARFLSLPILWHIARPRIINDKKWGTQQSSEEQHCYLCTEI